MNELVLDALDVGVLVADAQHRITFANEAAEHLLGDAAIGRPLGASLVGCTVGDILDLGDAGTALEPGTQHRFESRVLVADADLAVDVDVTVTVHENGLVVVVRDRSEERRMQEEMRRVERLVAIGTMVAGFAHEVRNPVASLRAITEALDEELHDRGLSLPHTTRLIEVLGRIERLVRTSLEFGRPTTPKPTRLSPIALLRSAIAAVGPRTAGAHLHLEAPPELPDIFVDEGQLVQVLVILLNNALDAAGSPAKVCARALLEEPPSRRDGRRPSEAPAPPGAAERSASRVRLEIVDVGPGIPPAAITHVFDAFFTTKASGTGLGLAIAQKIVAENGAHIEVASPSAPTVFAVLCPIA